MFRSLRRDYLYCQAIGWSAFALMAILPNQFLLKSAPKGFIVEETEFVLLGVMFTHILRNVMLRNRWLDLRFHRCLARLLPALVLSATAAALINAILSSHPFQTEFLLDIGSFTYLFIPWVAIYLLIHHIRETRIQARKKQDLEWLLNEKQNLPAGAEVSIDDLAGALDHIRSLIDIDPDLSRKEITEFSNLLRRANLKS